MGSKYVANPVGMRTRTRTRISNVLPWDELFLDTPNKSHFPKSSIRCRVPAKMLRGVTQMANVGEGRRQCLLESTRSRTLRSLVLNLLEG